jgi:hypothetical protein
MVESEIPIQVDIKFEYVNRELFELWTKGYVELIPKGKLNYYNFYRHLHHTRRRLIPACSKSRRFRDVCGR